MSLTAFVAFSCGVVVGVTIYAWIVARSWLHEMDAAYDLGMRHGRENAALEAVARQARVAVHVFPHSNREVPRA